MNISYMWTDAGQVFVWGYGILGKGPVVDRSQEPTAIPLTLFGCNEFNTETKISSIYGGLSQFAAITNAGDLYIWGRNRFGSLGLGHLNNQFFPIKVIDISLNIYIFFFLLIFFIDKYFWIRNEIVFWCRPLRCFM